jgi:hypothetical protein
MHLPFDAMSKKYHNFYIVSLHRRLNKPDSWQNRAGSRKEVPARHVQVSFLLLHKAPK